MYAILKLNKSIRELNKQDFNKFLSFMKDFLKDSCSIEEIKQDQIKVKIKSPTLDDLCFTGTWFDYFDIQITSCEIFFRAK